ncbi:response regulator [Sneathiella marina]|uniref:Response regulator n=1 Tax=Sneathiella marina TaxID=2950108 RepID=A0ABY4W2H7_9PROT|nr:response regulator [Sneathiella marina]USG61064.1 response regulator [Sneathiella marina]
MARILVAEDEGALREFVSRALTHHGHEVSVAEDGAVALDMLAKDPTFDLLLTDIMMPIMDGIALALKVTKENPKLKILMMTGYAAERQRAHNLDSLIHDVIAKPFTLSEICEKVDEALASAAPAAGAVTTRDEGLVTKE